MVLFLRRSALLLITMILIVSYLIINLRHAEPVISNKSLSVVLDAGHGSPDGGSVGKVTGAEEKDLNLSVALKVREKLESAGITVIMTRTDDNGIHSENCKTIREKKKDDLKTRAAIANESGADLLISIHMNFFGIEKYSGPQIFYSSGISGSEILAADIRESILKTIGPHCNRETKPVKDEIYLLRECQIPAALIECGFLSNAAEEKLLISDKYQDKLAKSIADGVVSYLVK